MSYVLSPTREGRSMYSNDQIIEKMQADKYLALKLEQALAGVKDAMLEHGEKIASGATRIVYYTSCFTDNYQDVCAAQKSEDIRFMLAIGKLVTDRSIIEQMIRIYVNLLLDNLTQDRIDRIYKALLKRGANLAAGTLTVHSLSATITTAACYAFSLSVSIERVLLRYTTRAVTITGLYGYVQEAADAANRLKQLNTMYYSALYAEKLEMMYFLIEPVISKNPPLRQILSSDDEIADAIMRITR